MATVLTTAEYLDFVKVMCKLKNDAALSRAAHLRPPIISKLRNGKLPLSPTVILRLHEYLGLSIDEMRRLVHAHQFSHDARRFEKAPEVAEA